MLFLAGRGKLRETRQGARAKEKARQNVNGADPRTACNKAERVVREAAELGGEGGGRDQLLQDRLHKHDLTTLHGKTQPRDHYATQPMYKKC